MTTLYEAAQQALDFIVATNKSSRFWLVPESNLNKTVTALKAALAEPVQKPVAKAELMLTGGNAGLATRIVEIDDHLRERLRPGQLLYTSPPQRKPLTDAEIADIWNCFCDELGEASINDAIEIARAIERAHGITTNERKLK